MGLSKTKQFKLKMYYISKVLFLIALKAAMLHFKCTYMSGEMELN